jgi:glycerophosphoryl diester phosphodiesterase
VTTLRLAHRGDHRRLPENSLAALVAGARAPMSDGVEFDVRVSADGVPVVIHDATLERTHGLPAAVTELSGVELARHGVPSLADVLAALPARSFVDVELKVVPGPEVAAVLAAARGASPARAVVSSFDPDALEAFAGHAPGWPRWANVLWVDEGIVALAGELGCRGIAAAWGAIDRRTAGLVSAAGMDLAAWTVTRRPTFDRLARLDVAAACVEGSLLDR